MYLSFTIIYIHHKKNLEMQQPSVLLLVNVMRAVPPPHSFFD